MKNCVLFFLKMCKKQDQNEKFRPFLPKNVRNYDRTSHIQKKDHTHAHMWHIAHVRVRFFSQLINWIGYPV